MTGCEGGRELAQAYLDGTLSGDERAHFEGHLHACPSCRRMVAEYRWVFTGLGEPAIPPVPAGFRARMMARLAQSRRRQRVWQSVVAAAAMLAVGTTLLALMGGVPEALTARLRQVDPMAIPQAVWQAVEGLAGGAAAVSGDWLSHVPGGSLVIGAALALLGAQSILVFRWRTLASLNGENRPRVLE